MAETTGRLRRLTLAVMLVVGIALCAALLLVTPDKSSAYSTSSSGYSGSVTGYKVQGTHLPVSCGIQGYYCYTPYVKAPGPTVYRSRASTGTQKIGVLYTLYRWNGSGWAQAGQKFASRYLYAGYNNIGMPRADFYPGNGNFRVVMVVGWSNSDGSRTFGNKVLDYNQVGDYSCNTNLTTKCDASNSWVWLRGAP